MCPALQVHGFPKVMGVLTHLDGFRDASRLKKTKKKLKQRFWTEIYDGAKLFYLSGIQHGAWGVGHGQERPGGHTAGWVLWRPEDQPCDGADVSATARHGYLGTIRKQEQCLTQRPAAAMGSCCYGPPIPPPLRPLFTFWPLQAST